ncbi:MAG: L,D-transpeptidase family protein [Pseudomonadota bacterium]
MTRTAHHGFLPARRLAAPLLILLLALVGCGGEDETPAEDPAAPAEEAPGTASPGLVLPREMTDAPSGQELQDKVRKKAARKKKDILKDLATLPNANIDELVEATLDFVEYRFTTERIFYSRYLEEFDRKLRARQDFAPLLREVYGPRQHRLLFHDFRENLQTLTEEGGRLLALLQEMPTHGLAAADYRLGSLEKQIERYGAAKVEYLAAREGEFSPREKAFWGLVSAYADMPENLEVRRDLLTLELTNQDLVALKNFQVYYQKLMTARASLNDAAADIDIDLLQGFFRFQLDFVHVIRAHPFKTNPTAGNPAEIHLDALRIAFQKAEGNFVAAMLPLIPDNPIYHRLREGLVLYERLQNENTLESLQIKGTLTPGQHGDKIQLLTRRLAAESYLTPEQVGAQYTPAVSRAVKWYQTTHQLEQDGKVGPITRRSINVSPARRARQIRLGLQRWRESEIHRDRPEFYLRVNIPQFEAELWCRNELVKVHRIVVGKHNKETNVQRKQRGYFNHTSLLKSRIETIVLKPRWYPPPRLQEELLTDLEADPAYFEKNNYGFIQKDDGSEIVYQKPGSDNALGLVKLLFPNEYKIYMHDTPKKALFNRPVRAYSHGCMRTENPLDLAQFLLERFNGMTKRDFDKILEKDPEKETWLKLNTKVPIYIEYNSVSADADGKIHFYIDIYDYDEAYWENRLPIQLTEELSNSEAKRLSGKSGGLPEGLLEGGGEEDDGVLPD